MPRTIFVAITGASGSCYAINLLKNLIQANCKIFACFSDAAIIVANTELDLNLSNDLPTLQIQLNQMLNAKDGQLTLLSKQNWFSPPASGSGAIDDYIICPCSMGTMSAVANGASNNLIERAADVALKERKTLIVMPRETPYSTLHLSNMLKLSEFGAIILPLSPGFYQKPKNFDDLANFMTARVFNLLKIPQTLLAKWGDNNS